MTRHRHVRVRETSISDPVQLGARLLQFMLDTHQLAGMDALALAVQDAIAPLGMTAAASGLVSGPRAASGVPFHFTNWPADWMAVYMASEFVWIDPTPRWARNSGVALTWSDLFLRLPPRDGGREVIEAARRFGYTEGMTIPVRSGGGFLGLVVFGGKRGPLDIAEQAYLAGIGRAAFEAAERLEHGADVGRPAAILSAREIDCVGLLVRGHSDRLIGQMLGLSVSTVRFHLGNARDKFDAVSRTHLAALAVAQGFAAI
jgi:LuxR family transcriptional activator of bioluminescence operon